jgi:hypothetical protein
VQNVQLEPLGWSLAVWSARQFGMTAAAGLDTPASVARTIETPEDCFADEDRKPAEVGRSQLVDPKIRVPRILPGIQIVLDPGRRPDPGIVDQRVDTAATFQGGRP